MLIEIDGQRSDVCSLGALPRLYTSRTHTHTHTKKKKKKIPLSAKCPADKLGE